MPGDDWRPLQFFLDDSPMAVAEVQARNAPTADGESTALIFRCTCKAYSDRPMIPCGHIQLVFQRVKTLGGTYITPLRRPLPPVVLFSASHNPAEYRDLMLRESQIHTLTEWLNGDAEG